MVDPIVFPTDISAGSRGGPRYSTTVVTSLSGAEQRIQNWPASRGKWNVAFGVKTLAQLQELQAFFHARAGMARGFLFWDHRDNTAVSEQIGVGDGTTQVFQLKRTYSSGGIHRVRKITRPESSSVTVFVNGIAASGWGVDATTGIVSFTTAPTTGAIITASFQFYVPARFASDEMNVSLEGIIGGWESIQIEEIFE
ncbi:MAG: DUF2460 domain-containing protein [Armatimonadetes bacterium]|nr:DUF2460 domain-containing protein [Armatimonadota bacterium]